MQCGVAWRGVVVRPWSSYNSVQRKPIDREFHDIARREFTEYFRLLTFVLDAGSDVCYRAAVNLVL